MFISIFNVSIYYLLIAVIQTVMTESMCIYDTGDGTKLDIRTLGIANGRGPKYDRIRNANSMTVAFSWNGCFPYSKSDAGNCTNAAACFTDSISNTSIIIAKHDSVEFKYNQGSTILVYQLVNIHLTVFLTCRYENYDTAIAYQNSPTTYSIYIQSRCCCPEMCAYFTHSISPVVILIIIITIFLLGYVIGGIVFLKCRRRMTTLNQSLCPILLTRIHNRAVRVDNQNAC